MTSFANPSRLTIANMNAFGVWSSTELWIIQVCQSLLRELQCKCHLSKTACSRRRF
jgi:hypothetical protein